MNWTVVIADIQAAGWSQPRIAAECGCAQSTISDLAAGRTKDPRYTIGEALKRLRDQVCRPADSTSAGEVAHA
jgi:predicted XRE-type DNA-binding protein